MNKFLILCLLLCASCYRVSDRINPCVSSPLQEQHFEQLQSAFPPLSYEERSSDWGREMVIAKAFADELDLYRAVSTYKRALILLPSKETDRKLEIQYDILLCFYLGDRYPEAIEAFERSDLAHVDKSFPAYHDLLLTLYECYGEVDNEEKQQRILELIEKSYPVTAEKLNLSHAIREGDIATVEQFADGFAERPSYLDNFVDTYNSEKKSVATAQALNALIPGTGYLYLGQTGSAFTAFFLNGLFIAAAVEFFLHDHVPAGIITSLFESGWYFGGIYGAGLEAKYYNERIYEREATCVLNEHNLFPVLMLEHSF
jgi:tetratricopeptide (TPR) repeat protein